MPTSIPLTIQMNISVPKTMLTSKNYNNTNPISVTANLKLNIPLAREADKMNPLKDLKNPDARKMTLPQN
ncbi:hypothetical protein I7I51_08048 [Histoplasma capsulatum]|uniref:Uncharacterized protein n=1 Tax=Ajellomyces capsulatus TaxID=5037 RepID=A0A8A1LXY2_AJECA|nr:hypothetical protein I7I51_08048 [Histoplasma capsulatum]